MILLQICSFVLIFERTVGQQKVWTDEQVLRALGDHGDRIADLEKLVQTLSSGHTNLQQEVSNLRATNSQLLLQIQNITDNCISFLKCSTMDKSMTSTMKYTPPTKLAASRISMNMSATPMSTPMSGVTVDLFSKIYVQNNTTHMKKQTYISTTPNSKTAISSAGKTHEIQTTVTPASKTTVTPVTKTTDTPATKTTVTPASKTTVTPASKTTVTPATKTAVTPASKTTVTPATKTTVTPATKTTVIPASKTTATPATKTTVTPATKTTVTPATKTTIRPSFKNCYDAVITSGKANGTYVIELGLTGTVIPVYCERMNGEAWLVIQRRQDGSIDFNRQWQAYKDGFGDLNGEFWLGNEKIHRLTTNDVYTLRIDMDDWGGNHLYAEYEHFDVEGERANYRLNVGSYHGTAGDSFHYPESYQLQHNSMPFSTPDRDHDNFFMNCADKLKSGWWFNSCYSSNLNGKYLGHAYGQRMFGETSGEPTIEGTGIEWYPYRRRQYSMRKVEMKIKLASTGARLIGRK